MRKSTLFLVGLMVGSLTLPACGYQLRGLQNQPIQTKTSIHHRTHINIDAGEYTQPLKHKLSTRLALLGIASDDQMSDNQIQISNVRFQEYKLIGVLSEVRLALVADVSYHYLKSGQKASLTQSLQVERSYQFNEASLAISDQQGDQARQWLYDSLVERIAEQYYALGLEH